MLKIHSESKAYPLEEVNNWYVDYEISGLNTLQFDMSTNHMYYRYISEETVMEYNGQLFAVKGINERSASQTATVNCELSLKGLRSRFWGKFNCKGLTLPELMSEILTDTKWTFYTTDALTAKRSFELDNVTPADVIEHCANSTVYNACFKFNAKQRIISLRKDIGKNRGAYFTDELNLIEKNFKGSSAKLITRLYAYGKDKLSIALENGGKEYVDCFDYTNEIICGIWSDERYTDAHSLYSEALKKVGELSRPQRAYTLKVKDLASLAPEKYGFLAVELGDKVTLIDRRRSGNVLHTVQKIRRYPKEPDKNELTISNSPITLTDRIKALEKVRKG